MLQMFVAFLKLNSVNSVNFQPTHCLLARSLSRQQLDYVWCNRRVTFGDCGNFSSFSPPLAFKILRAVIVMTDRKCCVCFASLFCSFFVIFISQIFKSPNRTIYKCNSLSSGNRIN